MSDLRKAAEMALEFIVLSSKDRAWFTEKEFEVVAELRQALAQPEQEQYVTKVVAMHEDGTYTTERIPLPKREWVGLTDEESIAMLQKAAKHKSPDYCTAPEMAVEFGRLTSEALKEKNP